MRKIIAIFTLLILVSITGCSNSSVNDRRKKDPPVERPEPNIETEELSVIEAIAKDKKHDGKSIMWDGNKVTIINDSLDSKEILDGRSGPYPHERTETKLGILLEYPITSYNRELFDTEKYPATDSENEYIAETPERYLLVQKSSPESYSQLEDELSANTDLMEVQEKVIRTQRDYKLFAGSIKTIGGKNMIGYILITPAMDQSVYCIKYAGFGNFSDIEVEGFGIMNDFFISN